MRCLTLARCTGCVSIVMATLLSGSPLQAEISTAPAQSAGGASTAPFVPQVVGLKWLNPLQRRDYPTEWQLLWTLGLVKPNINDDMVRTRPEAVSIVADGNRGSETFSGFYEKYVDKLLFLFRVRYFTIEDYFYTVSARARRK